MKVTSKAQPVWVTVSMTDYNPKGLIHLTLGGNKTLCNRTIGGGRWCIGTTDVPTCKICLKRSESK